MKISQSPVALISQSLEEGDVRAAEFSLQLETITRRLDSTCQTATIINGEMTLRSDPSGQTRGLIIYAVQLQEYLDEVATLRNKVEQFDWSKAKKPTIFADLRYLTVNGDATISTKCGINSAHATFNGRLTLLIQAADCRVSLGQTGFGGDVAVEVGAPMDTTLVISKSTFNASFELKGKVPAMEHRVAIRAERTIFGGTVKIRQKFALTEARFDSAAFKDSVLLEQCYFLSCVANFFNATFEKDTVFRKCFFSRAPNFHGARQHQDTQFIGCEFFAAGRSAGVAGSVADIASYRVLKGHFAKQRDTRQELLFYSLEQRAERLFATEGDLVERVLSWLYDTVSEYGRSASRAFYWFLGWNLAFATLFSVFASDYLASKTVAFLSYPGVALSLQNAFNPLALFADKGLVEISSGIVYGASLLQSLGSLGILTLFLLAIRGRFRKGGGGES